MSEMVAQESELFRKWKKTASNFKMEELKLEWFP